MKQIIKEEINNENILEVLRKAGIEFEEGEVVSRQMSTCPSCKRPADFVVKLDGIYRNVEILNQPINDRITRKIFLNSIGISMHRQYGDDCGSWIVLSLCEDSKDVYETFGDSTAKFPIRSLKAITLD